MSRTGELLICTQHCAVVLFKTLHPYNTLHRHTIHILNQDNVGKQKIRAAHDSAVLILCMYLIDLINCHLNQIICNIWSEFGQGISHPSFTVHNCATKGRIARYRDTCCFYLHHECYVFVSVGLFVCLFISCYYYSKSYRWIFVKNSG